jgi:hypothetical protein
MRSTQTRHQLKLIASESHYAQNLMKPLSQYMCWDTLWQKHGAHFWGLKKHIRSLTVTYSGEEL